MKMEAYLQAMDIQAWAERRPNKATKTPPQKLTSNPSSDTWEILQETVLNCTACDLSKFRQTVVFGTGNRQTDLLIVGEAPGANEDIQGLPFVGRAGMLLTSILQSIDLKREEVYITNILKCRPPQNRDPFPREIDCCTPYLQRQITLLQPKLIVALGRIAAQFLLKTTESLGKLRGHKHQYGEENTPLIITYHPAYLLRSPKEKAKAYVDWKWIQEELKKAENI